ncbi:hypothetical protein [Tenacibaculum sp. C7A-26P2]|uniref:hypothetical protein n=1 Tax=Tenacibaculum sp. C7A-26P2 TaxID=3447504 RepID=UPI003F831961
MIISQKDKPSVLGCKHNNTSIVIIAGFAEWEETELICVDCRKKISKPDKTIISI